MANFMSPRGGIYKTCNKCRAAGAVRSSRKRQRDPPTRGMGGPPNTTGYGNIKRLHSHDESLDTDPRGDWYKFYPADDPDRERAKRTVLAKEEAALLKKTKARAEDARWMEKMESRWQAHVKAVGIEEALKGPVHPALKLNKARDVKKAAAEAAAKKPKE